MIHYKLRLDATHMKVNVLAAEHITVESRCCVVHTVVNCFQKFRFSFNQISYGEDTTEQPKMTGVC
jgi:hypothetical protein